MQEDFRDGSDRLRVPRRRSAPGQGRGTRRVADEIASRLPKAFEILDAAWKKAEEDGDATLAWKLISTGLALEMRAEDKREREKKAGGAERSRR